MKKNIKYLSFLPVLLLASCNFKFAYHLPDGVSFFTESGTWGGDETLDDSGSYQIKVWVDTKITSLTEAQINNFVAASGGKYTITAQVQPMSEGEAATKMLQDVGSGADIFIFAQDQLSRLKTANALASFDASLEKHLKETHSEDSVAAASIADKMYAFPTTSDNGYFLYYDSSILTSEDVKDMDTMLAKLKAAKKKLNFDRKNGFYAASYFLATGCESHWTTDPKTGSFLSYDDNYNSEHGIEAGLAYRSLADNSVVATKSTWTNSAGAIITGVWEYEYIKGQFGDNLVCAELPSFTVNGKTHHMSSFDGYKLMGVKPQADKKKASVCRKLAEYLTNAENQLNRFKAVSWGPTNKGATENPDVQNHPALKALFAQHAFAHQQEQCPGAWFNSLGGLAGSITTTSTEADIQDLLNNYEAGLPMLLDE